MNFFDLFPVTRSFVFHRPFAQYALLLACIFAAMPPARATSLVVTSTADSGPGTLRAQVAAMNPGGNITFETNLSGATITLTTGQISIASSLDIDGSGLASPVRISGNNASRIFQVAANTTLALKSLILEDAMQTNDTGGAIRVDGSLVALNCSFIGNEVIGGTGGTAVTPQTTGGGGGGGAGLGGAIFMDGQVLTLAECTFTSNTAQGGAGGNGVEIAPFSSPGDGGGPNGGVNGDSSTGQGGGFGGGGGGGGLGGGFAFPGGSGGFGGGGGGGATGPSNTGTGGSGGIFGGNGGTASSSLSGGGGGGGGLGGAIFCMSGSIYITNCSFSGNSAMPGNAGTSGAVGMGVGGAIFDLSQSFRTARNTFSGNSASSSDADVHSPPTLKILVSGNLVFTWPSNAPGLGVQITTNLSDPASWQFLGTSSGLKGTNFSQVFIGKPSVSTYFRLAATNH